MESIAIRTTQNIAIEQPLASVGERIAATCLDYLIIYGYLIFLVFFSGIINQPTLIPILMAPLLFYHLIMEWAMNGQSLGKKILKIRVVKTDGTQPTFISFFLRWIFRLVDITMLFGAPATLTIILNGKGQRLGDITANTSVVRTKKSSLSDTIYAKIPDDYEVRYPEAVKLNSEDVHIIKEVLQFLKKSGRSMEAMHMADKAKKKLEEKMKVKAGLRSENFLFHLLRDYNFIHSR
jgi:uncharacterized RDD family membrane protein YckC